LGARVRPLRRGPGQATWRGTPSIARERVSRAGSERSSAPQDSVEGSVREQQVAHGATLRAVPSWHARLCTERRLSSGEAQLALAAFNALPGPGVETAVQTPCPIAAHGAQAGARADNPVRDRSRDRWRHDRCAPARSHAPAEIHRALARHRLPREEPEGVRIEPRDRERTEVGSTRTPGAPQDGTRRSRSLTASTGCWLTRSFAMAPSSTRPKSLAAGPRCSWSAVASSSTAVSSARHAGPRTRPWCLGHLRRDAHPRLAPTARSNPVDTTWRRRDATAPRAKTWRRGREVATARRLGIGTQPPAHVGRRDPRRDRVAPGRVRGAPGRPRAGADGGAR
jgi:hypothetical protein